MSCVEFDVPQTSRLITPCCCCQANNSGGEKLTHELELEILDARKFLGYGFADKAGQDRDNRWEEAMDCVLNTVRLLNRNARPA